MAKKRRKAKRTTRKRPRSRARKKPVAKKSRSMEQWIFTGIVVIVLFALLFSIPSGNNGLTNQEDTQKALTELVTEREVVVEYTCKSNLECFLVNCKNSPENVECVNTIGMQNYYKNCDPAQDWNVNPVRDNTRCSCVDGLCK